MSFSTTGRISMRPQVFIALSILITCVGIIAIATAVSHEESINDPGTSIEGTNYFWIETHGITAYPETPANITGLKRGGGGLQGRMKANTGSWIHISPPVIYYWAGVQGIAIDYKLASGTQITRIEVWDGPTKKFSWPVNIAGGGPSSSFNQTFALTQFGKGLDIAIYVQGGPVQANNRFQIHSAGAYIWAEFT